jgi:RNA polymerase sigma-70 factor (ECF subfamily)
MGMTNPWMADDRSNGSSTPSDSALVDRVRRGERECFALIMRRYNQRLFRVARGIVGRDSEAEDVVQHAYVCAYAHLQQFAGAAAFSTWLTRIVINEALARIKNSGRVRSLDGDEHAPNWHSGATAFANPEDDLSRRELANLLEAAIDELPEICRVALILREVEGLSTAETAACLSITEEAVRARVHRARTLLRQELARRFGDVAPEVWSFAGERCRRITARVLAVLEPPRSSSRTTIAAAGGRR